MPQELIVEQLETEIEGRRVIVVLQVVSPWQAANQDPGPARVGNAVLLNELVRRVRDVVPNLLTRRVIKSAVDRPVAGVSDEVGTPVAT